MTPVQLAAREAHAAGLCVWPPRENGSKRPVGAWKIAQTTRSTEVQIASWYRQPHRLGFDDGGGFWERRVPGL